MLLSGAAPHNPFGTPYIVPGALPYQFPAMDSLEHLLDRIEQQRWTGQIIGPHGTGKSTLLVELIAGLEQRHCLVHRLSIHDGGGRLEGPPLPTGMGFPSVLTTHSSLEPVKKDDGSQAEVPPQSAHTLCPVPPQRKVAVLDSFEQLSWWQRRCTIRAARRNQWGLIVTAHHPVGLPTLLDSTLSPDRLQTLWTAFLAHRTTPVTFQDLQTAFAKHKGNLREAWFELYDLHEQRSSQSAATLERTAPLSLKPRRPAVFFRSTPEKAP